MKVVVTGASGGIGRSLTDILRVNHEVTGIVRTPRASDGPVSYVAYSDTAAVGECLAAADCVIHCALDTKVPGKDFLSVNLALNRDILERAKAGRCRLFVFMSSQVVYATTKPEAHGYVETQECAASGKEDGYTALKLISEQMVIEACRDASMGYLILRPTVVMGDGFSWSDGMVKMARLLPVGFKGKTMNLVHVSDLSRFVEKLIELDVHNEIVNIGGTNHSSEDYYRYIGKLAARRVRFLPAPMAKRLGSMMPSTLWFFRDNVAINCDKVRELTGLTPLYSFTEANTPEVAALRPTSLEELRDIQRAPKPFKAHGVGYYSLFSRQPSVGHDVLMDSYSGVVSLEGDRVTVRAGTLLSELGKQLEKHNLTLATLPEFTGVTAGACFFVDVHGSSREHFSLYDLILEVKYLDEEGNIVVSKRNDQEWERLRRRDSGFLLTDVTFACQPSGYLSNRLEWEPDEVLETYILGKHRENLSTTLQWYPFYKQCLVYNINVAEDRPFWKSSGAKTIYRHLPYRFTRRLIKLRMAGANIQYDRYHRIMGPWQDLPFRKRLMRRWPFNMTTTRFYDLEVCVGLKDAANLITTLRQMIQRGEIVFDENRSLGVRFAYRRDASGAAKGYSWLELVSEDGAFVDKFVETALSVCGEGVAFHRGKYLPPVALSQDAP